MSAPLSAELGSNENDQEREEHMTPTEDPVLVPSTPKGSDLEPDDRKAIERVIKDAFSRLLAGEYDPALQGYEYRSANKEAALNAATDRLLSLLAARKGQGEWRGQAGERMAFILKDKLERGQPIDAEALDRIGAMVDAISEPITDADRAWAAETMGALPPPSKQEE